MSFESPPLQVAYRHQEAREGFEVSFLKTTEAGTLIEGETTAVEDDVPWVVEYAIELDRTWTTRRTRVSGGSPSGRHDVVLEADGGGRWTVNSAPAPHLDGCLDVDLESSALTNAFPIRRLGLGVGDAIEAPAAYVRAVDLAVERLEQRYERIADHDDRQQFEYASPAFGFACRLVYGGDGFVLDYPGIATRVA